MPFDSECDCTSRILILTISNAVTSALVGVSLPNPETKLLFLVIALQCNAKPSLQCHSTQSFVPHVLRAGGDLSDGLNNNSVSNSQSI
jgi:hypothetical protein